MVREQPVWAESYSPKSPKGEVLTPSALRMWLHLETGSFKGFLRQKEIVWVGPNWIGMVSLQDENRMQTHRGKKMWGHREKTDICKPWGEDSEEASTAYFQPWALWRNKFLLFNTHTHPAPTGPGSLQTNRLSMETKVLRGLCVLMVEGLYLSCIPCAPGHSPVPGL